MPRADKAISLKLQCVIMYLWNLIRTVLGGRYSHIFLLGCL
jgi:hypothetical protein